MGELVKWAFLAAAVAGLIAIIITLTGFEPDFQAYLETYNDFLDIIRPYTQFGAGLIGYVFPSAFHPLVIVVFAYMISKPFVTMFLNVLRGVYAWIFK